MVHDPGRLIFRQDNVVTLDAESQRIVDPQGNLQNHQGRHKSHETGQQLFFHPHPNYFRLRSPGRVPGASGLKKRIDERRNRLSRDDEHSVEQQNDHQGNDPPGLVLHGEGFQLAHQPKEMGKLPHGFFPSLSHCPLNRGEIPSARLHRDQPTWADRIS